MDDNEEIRARIDALREEIEDIRFGADGALRAVAVNVLAADALEREIEELEQQLGDEDEEA